MLDCGATRWQVLNDRGRCYGGQAEQIGETFMRALSAGLAIFLMTAFAHAADLTTIGVNAFPNAKALPLHAGIAHGIFEKRGLKLELELTEGATAQRQGFAAGKFQIVHSAIDNAVYNI